MRYCIQKNLIKKTKLQKVPTIIFLLILAFNSVSLPEFLPDSALLCVLNHIFTFFSGSNKSIGGPWKVGHTCSRQSGYFSILYRLNSMAENPFLSSDVEIGMIFSKLIR